MNLNAIDIIIDASCTGTLNTLRGDNRDSSASDIFSGVVVSVNNTEVDRIRNKILTAINEALISPVSVTSMIFHLNIRFPVLIVKTFIRNMKTASGNIGFKDDHMVLRGILATISWISIIQNRNTMDSTDLT